MITFRGKLASSGEVVGVEWEAGKFSGSVKACGEFGTFCALSKGQAIHCDGLSAPAGDHTLSAESVLLLAHVVFVPGQYTATGDLPPPSGALPEGDDRIY